MTRRQVICCLACFGVVISSLIVTAWTSGYRLNLTPSEPIGLWRIEALQRDVGVGDLIFVCPPATATSKEARRRGYLRWGYCPGGFAPLIKTVAAVGGQRVEVGARVVIDGNSLEASTVRTRDGKGRALTTGPGGRVPLGHLFLHSDFASSYDSRYFGPVPAFGVLGLARPILTVDP